MAASGNPPRMHRTLPSSRAAAGEAAFLQALRRGSGFFDARSRVKRWTRERFALDGDGAVAVSEEPTVLPGFPPVETRIEFWTDDGTRHHFKVFKALADVRLEDFPPPWMKDALAVPGDYECDCC